MTAMAVIMMNSGLASLVAFPLHQCGREKADAEVNGYKIFEEMCGCGEDIFGCVLATAWYGVVTVVFQCGTVEER
jgi:hypothetical protein